MAHRNRTGQTSMRVSCDVGKRGRQVGRKRFGGNNEVDDSVSRSCVTALLETLVGADSRNRAREKRELRRLGETSVACLRAARLSRRG